MDNQEEILDALTALGKNPSPQEIPPILEQYLRSVAKSGETFFPWSQLKPLILRKMELVILELRRNLASENIPTRPNVENVRFDVMHARIIDALHKFNGAPFTIQRLCELLIEPKRHYKRSDKYMRGLEKNVLVVSTVDPFGRKVVCESGSKPVLNGVLDVNGSYLSRDGGLSVPLPPVPGWVNTPGSTSATNGATSNNHTKGLPGTTKSQSPETDGEVSNSESVFAPQGDALPIQSEEVIEETVVTMDTGEVGADAGEAMADREGEEMSEDREASSFSSSSSSSEELSTSSDSVENMRVSPFGAENGVKEDSVMDEQRPWAAFAQQSKQDSDVTHSFSTNNQSKATPDGIELSSAISSSLPVTTSSSPPSSSSHTKMSMTASSEADNDQTIHQADVAQSDQSVIDIADQSLGFEPINPSADNDTAINFSPEKEKLVSSSSLSLTSTTTANVTTTTSTSVTDNTSTHTLPASSDSAIQVSSTGHVALTYAQVVASSSTDNQSSQPSQVDVSQSATCDSVAGLERLVGSMEPTVTSPETSSSLLSQPMIDSTNPNAKITPSLPESSDNSNLCHQVSPSTTLSTSDNGEPVNKRQRLSEDETSMEADCISTSEDLCMEESLPRKRPVVHSSVEVSESNEEEEMMHQEEGSSEGDVGDSQPAVENSTLVRADSESAFVNGCGAAVDDSNGAADCEVEAASQVTHGDKNLSVEHVAESTTGADGGEQ